MERPAIPAYWRRALLALAILPLSLLVPYLTRGGDAFFFVYLLWALGSFGIGVALAASMMRRGGLDLIAAFAGVVVAVVYAFVGQTPFHLLAGFGLGVALGLVIARPDPVPTALAAIGFVATVLAMQALMSYRGPAESLPRWPEVAFLLGTLTTGTGLAAYALRARIVATRPGGNGVRIASIAAGLLVLGLGWLIGGSFMLVPLWPIAFGLIALPALLRWRAWPAGAIVVGAIALAGAAPAGACVADPWSDAMVPGQAANADARPTLVRVYEIAGNGPRWNEGDGFSGRSVTCPASVVAFGALWLLALVVASGVVALGRRPHPVAALPADVT